MLLKPKPRNKLLNSSLKSPAPEQTNKTKPYNKAELLSKNKKTELLRKKPVNQIEQMFYNNSESYFPFVYTFRIYKQYEYRIVICGLKILQIKIKKY